MLPINNSVTKLRPALKDEPKKRPANRTSLIIEQMSAKKQDIDFDSQHDDISNEKKPINAFSILLNNANKQEILCKLCKSTGSRTAYDIKFLCGGCASFIDRKIAQIKNGTFNENNKCICNPYDSIKILKSDNRLKCSFCRFYHAISNGIFSKYLPLKFSLEEDSLVEKFKKNLFTFHIPSEYDKYCSVCDKDIEMINSKYGKRDIDLKTLYAYPCCSYCRTVFQRTTVSSKFGIDNIAMIKKFNELGFFEIYEQFNKKKHCLSQFIINQVQFENEDSEYDDCDDSDTEKTENTDNSIIYGGPVVKSYIALPIDVKLRYDGIDLKLCCESEEPMVCLVKELLKNPNLNNDNEFLNNFFDCWRNVIIFILSSISHKIKLIF